MKKFKAITGAFIFCLVCLSCTDRESAFKEYIEREDWDSLLQMYDTSSDSLRANEISYIDIALAAKGELAERAFNYLQGGPACLFPDWHLQEWEAEILTDIYYQAGHIALAQRMAFEADVCYAPEHSNRMLKRLVQTNIIYCNWPIAEKYICILEKEGGKWRDWATAQREFLNRQDLVEQNEEYGIKKRCIPDENFISLDRGIVADLKDIIKANPEHRNTVEILGVYYLLALDFGVFKEFLDEYHGTEILPELPRSFAEAACMLSEETPGYWKTVGVGASTYREYVDFKNRMSAGLSLDKYRGTYWVYVMKMNTR